MNNTNIAIISESPKVTFDEIAKVAAAVTRQVNDHLSRFWPVRASISAFAQQSDVPLGYWRVSVIKGRPECVLGIHRSKNGEPFALVSDEDHWSIAISHEVLEMLIDPTLSNFRAGNLPNGGPRVNFLVEICDPCQSSAYPVNGVAVSDFVTPAYFDPDLSGPPASEGGYSFQGSISKPRTVAPGGYLVWLNPTDDQYYAFTSDGRVGRTITLGPFPGGFLTTREWVDSILRKPGIPLSAISRRRLQKARIAHEDACIAHAKCHLAARIDTPKIGKGKAETVTPKVRSAMNRKKPQKRDGRNPEKESG